MQGEASSDGVLNDEPHHAAVCRKVGKVFFFRSNRGRDVGI